MLSLMSLDEDILLEPISPPTQPILDIGTELDGGCSSSDNVAACGDQDGEHFSLSNDQNSIYVYDVIKARLDQLTADIRNVFQTTIEDHDAQDLT